MKLKIGEEVIKAVIFDMDGVVVDTGLMHNLAEQKLLADLGIHMTLEEIRKYAGTAPEVWFKMVLEKNDKRANTKELAKKKYEMVYDMLDKSIPIIPGFLQLFELLKKNGIEVALASGSSKRFINFIVSKLGLGFDAVISSEEVSKGKPNPDLFLAVSKKLRIKPENCLVVEDAHLGVLAAKRAGMKCIAFINKNSGNQDLSKAALIVDNLNEITLDKIQNL